MGSPRLHGNSAELCKYFMEELYEYLETNDMSDEKFAIYENKLNGAMFDSRVFNLPESEVCNYFIWRQNDATRNSIELLGREYFSAKESVEHSFRILRHPEA